MGVTGITLISEQPFQLPFPRQPECGGQLRRQTFPRSWNSPISGDAWATVEELPSCDGNYTYFKMDGVGAWRWVNELNMMYIAEDGETGRGNIPIFPSMPP
ncbi:MAG: hypothetical protein R2788_02890 [Saprospiraceae bacterium]